MPLEFGPLDPATLPAYDQVRPGGSPRDEEPRMYVGSVTLENWKNFKTAKTKLGQRAYFIGPNASGKSNLLDAFRFLRDLARSGLEAAVRQRSGVSALRCLAARKSSSIALEVEVMDGKDQPRWRYRIEFNQDRERVPIVRQELVQDLGNGGKTRLSRPNANDREDRILLTETHLETKSANRDFRDIADFFASISYQHVVPQAIRDSEGFTSSRMENDPFGRDLLQRIWNTQKSTRDARLLRISKVLGRAVPQLTSIDIDMDQARGIPHLVGRYQHWRPHAARQNETQFSDGTLRLFGLMWSMFEGSGPLLLEEPELSLHPEVVRSIPALFVALQEEIKRMKRKAGMTSRQVLISTHSEELLSDPGIGGEEVIRIEPSPEGSVLREPSDSDREMLSGGLTVADVLLPKSAPGQMIFEFD